MITKFLYGLITLTSALLAVANIALQENLIAAIAIVSGATWLLLQIKMKESPNSIFFVLFLGLIIIGTLRSIPVSYMLLVLSSDLAAWDLSRFQARISHEEVSTSKTLLELKHLQKLVVTVSAGFLIALLPMVIHISLNFVAFLFLFVLLMLTLRKSVLYLRKESDVSY